MIDSSFHPILWISDRALLYSQSGQDVTDSNAKIETETARL